jgi:hypothetical protein
MKDKILAPERREDERHCAELSLDPQHVKDPCNARTGIITELEEGFRYWFDDVEMMPIHHCYF